MNRTEQMLGMPEQDTTTTVTPQRPATGWTERLFKLREHNTTVRTEVVAGLTTAARNSR